MSAQGYQTPDLASVLQTLASLTPHPQQPHQLGHKTSSNNSKAAQPLNSSLKTATAPPPKLVDPATIINWSAGLRCVMKTVAAHDNIIGEIRRMMKTQHEHELQWWHARQALLSRQEARIEGQKKLEDVLRAVGGTITTSNQDKDGELKTFDMKVYRAQVQMVKEMSTKLKSLGVPFFGTRNDLVQRPGETAVESTEQITEAELVKLQKTMIMLLEDLCKE